MNAPSPGATSPTSRRSWQRASCRGAEHDLTEALPVIERPTARVIALDDAARVLLFQIEDLPFPHVGDPKRERPLVFWITAGGGVEPGESFEEAARREPREVTGFAPESIGPCLFEDDVLISKPDRDIRFRIRFYLARVSGDVSLNGLDAIDPAHIAALVRAAGMRCDTS